MEKIKAGSYSIVLGGDLHFQLTEFLKAAGYSQVFLLADDHTVVDCFPLLGMDSLAPVVIPHGEMHKTIASCESVWQHLTEAGADRKAVLINVGGGMIGDLGGYAASCYKRGIDFIQVPTSLLSMVDASVGGKTGVNFAHFKNQVGLFRDPAAVFIHPSFLQTLPERELLSGYAEVLKHCLIADRSRWEYLIEVADISQIEWSGLIADSVRVKLAIVTEDPFEKGPRKALNFGHTVGHALESFYMEDSSATLLHGEAVLLGMLCESWISWQRDLLTKTEWDSIAFYLRSVAPKLYPNEADRLNIAQLATQDKKNEGKRILCTLLNGIGGFKINQEISIREILDSLDAIFPVKP